jgi:metal-responsive CopG/Arc/MetJ family transcriptional regulator
MAMELMQVRLPQGIIAQVDAMVKNGIYASKSDFIRDAIRRLMLDRMVGIIPNKGDSVKEVRTIRSMLTKTKIDLEEINRL